LDDLKNNLISKDKLSSGQTPLCYEEGITCSSLCLKDIQKFSIEDNRYLLRLNLREFKGTLHQDHPENFESSFSSDKNIDFIHWFSLHLLKKFNLVQVSFHNWKLTDEEKNLFI
jgi:hypothetical protein